MVSIRLDSDDNPYLVFESLNTKGKDLTQADLIRNYFFMRIDVKKQEEIHKNYWLPMQETLQDDLTEFIRHFLMKNGTAISEKDIYYTLKDKELKDQESTDIIDYLEKLQKYSLFYKKIKYPHSESEKESEIQQRLIRLNRIEVTPAYPLILNFYNDYHEKKISKNDFVNLLKIIENYCIRRFICSYSTRHIDKVFLPICAKPPSIEALKSTLQSKDYPKDKEFCSSFYKMKLYKKNNKNEKIKLILETIEQSYGHKETISFNDLTVEHVMPQTLSEEWQEHLGEDGREIHEQYCHTIGNLTLTAYNPELSNNDFSKKKKTFKDSHLEMNKYFTNIDKWGKGEIEARAEELSKKAIEIWGYFGDQNSIESTSKEWEVLTQ